MNSTIRNSQPERSSRSLEPEDPADTSALGQSLGSAHPSGASATTDKPADDPKFQWFVRFGWMAALISGVTTILVVAFGTNPEGRLALIDAAIFLALGWGIYWRSRVAAVLALLWWVFERIFTYRATGNPYLAFGIGPIIFSAAYVLAIVALFATHPSASGNRNARSRLG